MKFNRVIPATLQQHHLILLTHVLVSDLLTGEAGCQPVAYLQESVLYIYIPLTGLFQMFYNTERNSYLPDAVCDGPGEEDPGHDLESGQNYGGWYNSWGVRRKMGASLLQCKSQR